MDNAFNLRCPACGESGEIDIQALVWVRATHDGTDIGAASNGDHEWTDDSHCQCGDCGHEATVRAFEGRAEELTTLLTAAREAMEFFEQSDDEESVALTDKLKKALASYGEVTGV